VRAALTIGHVLPAGADVAGVTLDGRGVSFTTLETARGTEVVVDAGTTRSGTSTLVVRLG